MVSPIDQYKAKVALKVGHEKRRAVIISIVAFSVLVLATTGAVYHLNLKERVEQSAAVRQKATEFYTEFIHQINTNENWVGFVDEYTIGDAKEDVSITALEALDSSARAAQYIVRFISPVSAETFEISGNSAAVLVDFDLGERIAGDPERISAARKYLTLERIDGSWFISGIYDRSDRFDEAHNI